MRPVLPLIFAAAIALAVLAYMVLASRPNRASQQRRHPRLDIAVPVHIHTEDERHDGESRNISQGGMLLQAHAPVSIAQPVRLKFTLPSETPLEIPAVVSYKKGQQIGLRFDPTHHTRADIERWISQSRSEAPADERGDSATSSGKS
ncbi:MAG: PilZ domain-containing protein [Terriglobales bacterium]